MGSVFKFKRFEVDQSDCAMRINTDGVLLAVLASQDAPSHILDVGTGTGVIALMLAQRYEAAKVDAVEIDAAASNRAGQNFKSSDFASRLSIYCTDIALFDSEVRYDLILSNPPFFVKDLKSTEPRKGIARHAHDDFFDSLITKVASLLTPTGLFWVILPIKQAEHLIIQAEPLGLYPSKIIHVFSDESKSAFRQIVCFSFTTSPLVEQNFYIYAGTGEYTDAYVNLLKDFFLAY
jgi:tRNA1Val (adenine37-N6)-methyltransferase